MIKGRCTTNLDDYHREEWPTSFVVVPRKGDYVASASGKRLKVVYVMHIQVGGEPRIIVELNKGCGMDETQALSRAKEPDPEQDKIDEWYRQRKEEIKRRHGVDLDGGAG